MVRNVMVSTDGVVHSPPFLVFIETVSGAGHGFGVLQEGKISVYISVAGKILKSNKLNVACCSFNAKPERNKYPKSFSHTDSLSTFLFFFFSNLLSP